RHRPAGRVPHARSTTRAACSEHPAEQVLEAGGTGSAARAGGEPRPASGHGAQRVVLLALLGVGEHRVGLSDLLELLLGLGVPGVLVRVPGAGELAVGLLDRGGVGVLGHTQRRVEVLLQPVLSSHRATPPSIIIALPAFTVGRSPPRGPAGRPSPPPGTPVAAPGRWSRWSPPRPVRASALRARWGRTLPRPHRSAPPGTGRRGSPRASPPSHRADRSARRARVHGGCRRAPARSPPPRPRPRAPA